MAAISQSIECDAQILRTRRTAAITRFAIGVLGIVLVLSIPELASHKWLTAAGFGTILLTSIFQLFSAHLTWMRVEESLAATAAILIVGLGDQRVTVLSLLWLVALATGVMARGGRVHWLGRSLVVGALALPVILDASLSAEYAAFFLAVIGLQLVSGRLTLELNRLLREARLEAENAETLLLAGEIASRVAQSAELEKASARPASPGPMPPMSYGEQSNAGQALDTFLSGEGMATAVQPIVDLRNERIHAYEALARFGRRRSDRSPANWFALADELGRRVELERSCLAAALKLFDQRPDGALLSVNVSVAGLLDRPTRELLDSVGAGNGGDLDGLIVEITEETLVSGAEEIAGTIAGLRRRGARLAVDDIGAGYSGLRQITTVCPDYLKLDRSLCAGIHADPDRAALVNALSGYADKVGSLIVAEGVEERAELDCLRELEVPLVQGFYLGAPGKPWPGIEGDREASAPVGLDRQAAAGADLLTPA